MPKPCEILATCVFQGSPTVTDRAIMPTNSSLISAEEKKFPLITIDRTHIWVSGFARHVKAEAMVILPISSQTMLFRTSGAHPPSGRNTCEAISYTTQNCNVMSTAASDQYV